MNTRRYNRLFLLLFAAFLMFFVLASTVQAVRLVWDSSTGVVTGYLVEYSDDGGVTWKYGYNVPDTQVQLDDKGVPLRTYQFRVRAFNQAGSSAPCAPVEWTKEGFEPPQLEPMPGYDPLPEPPVNPNIEQ